MKPYLVITAIASMLITGLAFGNDGPGSNALSGNLTAGWGAAVVNSKISNTIYVEVIPDGDDDASCSTYSNVKVQLLTSAKISEIASGTSGRLLEVDFPGPSQFEMLMISAVNDKGDMAPNDLNCLYHYQVFDSDHNSWEGTHADGSPGYIYSHDYLTLGFRVK